MYAYGLLPFVLILEILELGICFFYAMIFDGLGLRTLHFGLFCGGSASVDVGCKDIEVTWEELDIYFLFLGIIVCPIEILHYYEPWFALDHSL